MNPIRLSLYHDLRTLSRTFTESTADAYFPEAVGLTATAELSFRAIRGEALSDGWLEIARSPFPKAKSLRIKAAGLVATATVDVVGGLFSGCGESRACASVPLFETIMPGEVCGANPSFGGEAQDWVDSHMDAIEKRIIFGAKIIDTPWTWLARGECLGIAEVALPLWGADFHSATARIALSPNFAEED